MKIGQILAASAVGIFIFGVFYWALFIPKDDLSQRLYQTLKEQEKQADMQFKNVALQEVLAGQKYWELLADNGVVNKSTGIATLRLAKGTFYKQGRPVLRFRSPAALWDMKKKEIYLDKPLGYDVKLENKIKQLLQTVHANPLSVFNLPQSGNKKDPGYWFQANNLRWQLADEQIVCTGGIQLNKGDVSGFAQKLQGDVGLEKVLLEGNPWLVMYNNGAQPITLEATAFVILGNQDQFLAQGNSRVTWQTAQILSQTAVYNQNLSKLHLKGDVQIKYRDILAWGEAADYLTKEQKVIVYGHARAEQGESKLSGDRVVVSLKEQKISLAGKSRIVISKEELP